MGLRRVADCTIGSSGPSEGAETFLYADGPATADILLERVDFSNVKNRAVLSEEVPAKALQIDD